jgi:hypothetical protein
VLALAKSNLAGRGQHGLRFTITDAELIHDDRGGVGLSPSIRCDGETETTSADTLASGEERSALREAIEFLRETLADGPRPSGEVRVEAESQGIAERTLKRARAKICGRASKSAEGPWMVSLRGTPDPLGTHGTLGDAPGSDKSAKGAEGAKGGGVVLEFRLDSDPDSETDPPPIE